MKKITKRFAVFTTYKRNLNFMNQMFIHELAYVSLCIYSNFATVH